MKKTAVEWYEIEINSLIEKYEAKEISERDFITMKHNLFYPAKQMEKQQIVEARVKKPLQSEWDEAEQYYNEQFKNK
jgi:hypothetical protein